MVKVFEIIQKVLNFLVYVVKGVFNFFFHSKKDATGDSDGESK